MRRAGLRQEPWGPGPTAAGSAEGILQVVSLQVQLPLTASQLFAKFPEITHKHVHVNNYNRQPPAIARPAAALRPVPRALRPAALDLEVQKGVATEHF